MNVRIDKEGNMLIFKLGGEIDHHTAKSIREEIDRYTTKCNPDVLMLDFKNVEFMDSSGIGLVLGRYRLMQELGGSLKIINMPAHLCKVMRVAGIENLDISINGGDKDEDCKQNAR